MSDYTAVNPADGSILWSMHTNVPFESVTQQGTEIYIFGAYDGATQYYDMVNLVILNRPIATIAADKLTMTADGVDKVTITGIPNPATCSEGLNSVSVTDGTLEYTTDTPGQHVLTFTMFPYKPVEVTLDAT